MGVSIILIIVFHFTEDCQSYEYHYTGWIRWFRTYIGSSSVDAFLFFSGIGLYYSMKKNPSVTAFYQRRLRKLVIPYAIVALPAWVIMDHSLQGKSWLEVGKDFTFLSFFEDGDRWYWYIGLMLVCYFIYPYVFQIVDSARDAIDGEMRLIGLTSAITVIVLVIELYDKEVFSNTNIALLRLPIFLAGCFYGRSSYEERTSFWKWGILLVLSTILLQMLPADSPIFGRYVAGLFNVSVCAWMAWLFAHVSGKTHAFNWIVKILEWFGSCSLELYLVHVTFRKFMNELDFHTCHLRYELFMVAASVLVAIILHALMGWCQKRMLVVKGKGVQL